MFNVNITLDKQAHILAGAAIALAAGYFAPVWAALVLAVGAGTAKELLANQGERIGRAETAIAQVESHSYKVERKLDQWVNRGIGVWGLAVTLFALIQYSSKLIGK